MITKEDIEAFEEYTPDLTPMEMVEEYHEAAGITGGTIMLRNTLIAEEATEVLAASDAESCLKELADLMYVTAGYAVTFGWDLDEALKRVHENNMGRMFQPDGTIKRREDGKIMKNKDYPKVDLSDLV